MSAASADGQERRWVSVPEFAAYLGISTSQAWRMVHADPDVERVTKRVGRRVLICLWAWREGVEGGMARGVA